MSFKSFGGRVLFHTSYNEYLKEPISGKLKIFTRVVLPGSLPMVFAGMRLALGMSLLLVVAVEISAANRGLGAMIWLAWQTLRTERLYVGIVLCAVLGLLFSAVLRRIERRLMPWEDVVLRRS